MFFQGASSCLLLSFLASIEGFGAHSTVFNEAVLDIELFIGKEPDYELLS